MPPRISKKEQEERLRYACQLVADHSTKGEFKRAFGERFGLKRGMSEKYWSLVRSMILRELADVDIVEARGQSILVYREIIADRTQDPKLRMAAAERIDKLLGLEAPKRIEAKVANELTLADLFRDEGEADRVRQSLAGSRLNGHSRLGGSSN